MKSFLILLFAVISLNQNANAQWTGGGSLNDPMSTVLGGGSSGRFQGGGGVNQQNEGVLTIGRAYFRSDGPTFLDPGWAIKIGGTTYLNAINQNIPIDGLKFAINWSLFGFEWFPYISNTSSILTDPDAGYLAMFYLGIGPTVSYNVYRNIVVNGGLSIQPTLMTITDSETPFLGNRIGLHTRIHYTSSLFTGFDYTWGKMNGVIEDSFNGSLEVEFPTRRFEIILLGISF